MINGFVIYIIIYQIKLNSFFIILLFYNLYNDLFVNLYDNI